MSNEEWNTLFGELRGFVQEHEVGKEPSFDIIQVARRAHYLSPERYGDEVAPYLLDHGIEFGGGALAFNCHGEDASQLAAELRDNLLWVDLTYTPLAMNPYRERGVVYSWEDAPHPHPPTGLIRALRFGGNPGDKSFPAVCDMLEQASPSLRELSWTIFHSGWQQPLRDTPLQLHALELSGTIHHRRVTPREFFELLPMIEGLHTLTLEGIIIERGGVWPRAWERAEGKFPRHLTLLNCVMGGVGLEELVRHPGARDLESLVVRGGCQVELGEWRRVRNRFGSSENRTVGFSLEEAHESWRARLIETIARLKHLTTLELSDGAIEERDVPAVLECIEDHPHLASLTLSTDPLSNNNVDQLTSWLEGRALSFLDIKLPADLSLARWLKLLSALVASPEVHGVYAEASELDIDEGTLSLRGRALTDEACEALIAYPLAGEIERLDLGGAVLSAEHIARILGADVFTNLRELRIDTATVQGGYDRRAHSGHQRVRFGEDLRDKPPEQQEAQAQAKLRSLSILNTKVSPETLERWFQNLSRADLGILTLLNVGEGEPLLTWLTGQEGLTSLAHLRLDHNDLGGTSALARLKDSAFATTLKTLSLTHTKLTNQGAAHLLGALPSLSSLTELDLSDNALDARGLLPLDEMEPPAALTSLKLSGNALGRSGGLLWPRGFYALIEGKLGAQLTSLALERTDFVKLFDLLAETPGFGRLEQLACGSTKALRTHEVARGWFAREGS